MREAIEGAMGSVWFKAGVAVLVVLSLVLNGVALGRGTAGTRADDASMSRLDAVEAATEELRASQLELLDRAFRLQTDIAALAPDIDRRLTEASAELEAFRAADIVFDVAVNEQLPIDTEISIRRTIDVVIDTSLPINETIDTTIAVDGPFGLTIPVGVSVPIALDLPVNLTVPLTIDEQIPVRTQIPIEVAVPIAVDVDRTELVRLVDGLQTMLDALDRVLASLG